MISGAVQHHLKKRKRRVKPKRVSSQVGCETKREIRSLQGRSSSLFGRPSEELGNSLDTLAHQSGVRVLPLLLKSPSSGRSQLEVDTMSCQERGTDLLHLGVDGTRVDGEDVNVVAVGLDDLLSDRSRVEDHGELRAKGA
jgi:hypothetical protein